MDRLTTGQMAEMNGVTKKTLLVYQKNGILLPEIVDEETGYRYYSISQSSILDIIRRLQDSGLSIKEIRTVLDNRDVDYMERLLKRKRLALARHIEELELARLSNESLLDSCRIFKERPVCGVPALEWVPRRQALFFPVEPYLVAQHRSDETPMLARWEKSLRSIKRQMIERGLPLSLFHNVACVISLESLRTRSFVCTGGYVFNPMGLGDRPEFLPEGYVLTLTTDTMFDGEGYHMESKYLGQLLDIAAQRGYELRGDYYCEILAETPAFMFEARDMMIRLRLPVTVEQPQLSEKTGGTL